MFWARPFKRLGWDKEGDVGPVHGWIWRFEVRTWGNRAVMQGHDRLHDTRNASGGLEVADLGFD